MVPVCDMAVVGGAAALALQMGAVRGRSQSSAVCCVLCSGVAEEGAGVEATKTTRSNFG
jgi:hypothetical protein